MTFLALFLILWSASFLLTGSNKLPHNQILLVEPLLPPLQCILLLIIEITQRIQRPVQVTRQHILVEAAMSQSSAGISSSEVFVWSAWPVELAARGNIEDTASY